MKGEESGRGPLADQRAHDYSHVYVLTHRRCDLLKIGKANSVLDRAEAFGIDSIDLGRSFALRLNSSQQAVHVEKTLHKTFRKWAISKHDAVALGIPIDGATEWFSGSCRGRLLDYVGANSDLLEFTVLQSNSLEELLRARTTRRLELEQLREERRLQELHRRVAADVRQLSRDARLAARTAELEGKFEKLASLFDERMSCVESSMDAVFLGCNSPWEGRFELLFLSRPDFTPEGRDFVWVDPLEASVSADGYRSNLITSSAVYRGDLCHLAQVNVSLPSDRQRFDGQDWTQFSKFATLLRSRPVDSAFLDSTKAEICEAADCFFEAKRLQSRCEPAVPGLVTARPLELFDDDRD